MNTKENSRTIYTSYFGNLRNLGVEYKPVAISRFLPRGIRHMDTIKELAPPEYLLDGYKRGTIDKEMYVGIYQSNVLNKLNLEELEARMNELQEDGKKLVLVCYEKEGDFCHRHIMAKYLNSKGFDIRIAE